MLAMNDEQQNAMRSILADAFDEAACTCDYKLQAAIYIERALHAEGYSIVRRKKARGES